MKYLSAKPLLLLVTLSFALYGCDNFLPKPKPKEDTLPPATQTGANTFGCKLNGKVWVPKGKSSLFSVNFDVTYTADFGGFLTVGAYQYDKDSDTREDVGFVVDRVGGAMGTFTHAGGVGRRDQQPRFRYGNERLGIGITRCTDPGVYCQGQVTLTRLDMAKGIVSGTFECVIKPPDGDTVRVTEGRFDKQL